MLNISKMHILLTGATGGIGKASALRLAQQGVRIVAVGRNPETLQQLVQQLPKHPDGPHSFIVADLGQQQDIEALCSKIEHLEQPINTLINMAGVNALALFEDQSSQQIRDIINTNLVSTMLLTHALLPTLKSQPEARIINVGSTFGSIGFPGYVTYCSTKFALRGFTEALSRELSDSNIGVQYFAPRATQTPLNSDAANALNQALKNPVDSPAEVARELARFIRKASANRFLGWPEKLFVKINGLMPSIVSNSISKQLSTIKGHAQAR